MDKRGQILREIAEAPEDNDLSRVFEEMDKYRVDPPTSDVTRQLIQRLKPVLARETAAMRQGSRFRDILAGSQQSKSLPVILQLVGPQTALMSGWFVTGTVVFLVLGLMLSSTFESDSFRFLVAVSPVLGLVTLLHEYRAQIYKVEEMEAACRYSPAQVAAARIIVVLGYNVMLGVAATLLVETTMNAMIWKLIVHWLGPLLLIVGIALAASVKLGVLGGCLAAAAVWLAQLMLLGEGSFLQLLSSELTGVDGDVASMLLGVALIYLSLRFWRLEARLPQARQGG
jgi:hypothetical protein